MQTKISTHRNKTANTVLTWAARLLQGSTFNLPELTCSSCQGLGQGKQGPLDPTAHKVPPDLGVPGTHTSRYTGNMIPHKEIKAWGL